MGSRPHFKRGDRVALKLDADVRGTVRSVRSLRRVDQTERFSNYYVTVQWDDGRTFEAVQNELDRSTDDGPESLKRMFRF
jgi:hypothetical protein